MLEHGGRLRQAAARYGIPLGAWLDLSTGINPHAYPVPPIPAVDWQRLPEDDDGLEAAAAAYYGSDALVVTAGSQAALQALPGLVPGKRVTMLAPTYAEHPHAWRERRLRKVAAAHLDAVHLDAAVEDSDVVVLVHPNNPTGTRFARERLLDWHRRLAARGGWLVVDEAFVDTAPDLSLASEAGREGLVVLRSLGKFFGLAGARVGFVLAPAALRQRLAERLGPWAVSGPSRRAARAALADRPWQEAMRARLAAEADRLAALLRGHGLGPCSGPALFQWVAYENAAALHDALARRGILVRHFAAPASLRFGLPGDEAAWQRLGQALAEIIPALSPTHDCR